MPYGKRSFLQSPWHYCGRCDRKSHLDALTWQRGILLCRTCIDKHLVGDFEAKLAQVLDDGKNELGLDSKLSEASESTDDQDIYI